MSNRRVHFLEWLDLEEVYAARFDDVKLDYCWMNRRGESKDPIDFYIQGGKWLDVKGSSTYPRRGFISRTDLKLDRRRGYDVTYGVNDLTVVKLSRLVVAYEEQDYSLLEPKQFYNKKINAWDDGFVIRTNMTLEEWMYE